MKSSVIWSQSIHSFWFRASMNGQNAQKLAYYLFFFFFFFFSFFFFFFFLLHALFQWVVSYSILIHIIFVVSCELRIGMYWEFSVCRNLLCVSIFFVKLVAPESKHQSVLLTRFMSLLGLFSFGAKLNHAVYLPILGSFRIVDNAQLIELQL